MLKYNSFFQLHISEAKLSSFSATKTTYHNRLIIELGMRIQLFSGVFKKFFIFYYFFNLNLEFRWPCQRNCKYIVYPKIEVIGFALFLLYSNVRWIIHSRVYLKNENCPFIDRMACDVYKRILLMFSSRMLLTGLLQLGPLP